VAYGIVEYDEHGNPKCEICGRHYIRILLHARYKHSITEREYKLQFGLDLNKGICSKESSLRTREKTILNFDKCTAKAIAKGHKFEKGHPGRTKDMVSAQTKLMLHDRWIACVTTEMRAANGRRAGLGRLGGLARQAKWRENKQREIYGKAMVQPSVLKYLFSWCMQLTHNEDDAKDLMQETLLTAWLIHNRYNDHMQTWLCSIAKNKWMVLLKKRKHSRLDYVEDIAAVAVEEAEEYNEPEDWPYTLADLRKVFKVLSPMRQVAMYLMMQGHRYSTIAVMTESTEPNVKSMIFQARDQVKRILDCPNVAAALNAMTVRDGEFEGKVIHL
jgi:RNA polymerase sigma factor (sigma-70 family)